MGASREPRRAAAAARIVADRAHRGCDRRLAIAFAATRLLIALGPDSVPRLDELSIDCARVCVRARRWRWSTMVVFGVVPAIQAARQDPQDALRADGRHSTAGAGRRRMRAALTIGEVALSVALLIGAGLLIRSFARLQQVEPGFSTRGLMTARVDPAGHGVSERPVPARILRSLPRPTCAAAPASRPRRSRAARRSRATSPRGDVKLPTQSNDEAGIGGVAAGRARLLRHARHSPARARVHDAGHVDGAAGGDHQRRARREVFSERGSDRPAR